MRQRLVLFALATTVAVLTAGCEDPLRSPDAGDAGGPQEPGLADGGADYAFCPTAIDVYGASAAVLAGCGGAEAALTADGLFEPGDAGYEQTLAGRLRARLRADPEVMARFGEAFTVRSCARLGTMGSYLRQVPAAECASGGNTGDAEVLCSQGPAPLVLFDATNLQDRCHGGGPDSSFDDDPEGFAEHWTSRFEEFRGARAPAFLLVAPQLDWLPVGSASSRDCRGTRSAWNPLGGGRWRAQNPLVETVRRVETLQDEFERHHPCCAERAVACEDDWYSSGWTTFDCRGAQQAVDHWYQQLRGYLLTNRFACP
ncbi:MAG: hypothetical protein M3Y59_09325 [Myxococcota bacterium]|nr:hypothetical protein [Myxococcota bacterium]